MGGPLKRVGAIGDVHGEAELLARALERLRADGCERVLVVGDLVDGGTDANACCRLVDAADVVTVRGNHDRWLLEGEMRDLPEATTAAELDADAAALLSRLPGTARLDTVAGPLLLCHGLGEDDLASLLPEHDGRAIADNRALASLLATDLAVVVSGHTHRRMVRSFGALTLVNAGTLRRADGPSFATIDLEARRVDFTDFAGSELTAGPSYRFGLPGQDVWDAWGGVGGG
jgi:predicted phosphodiesterase